MPRANATEISRRSLLSASAAALGACVCGSCNSRSPSNPNHLEFWSFAGGECTSATLQRYWESVASAFMQQHREADVAVTAQIPYGHYMSVLGTRFIGQGAPDVMVLDDEAVFALADEGLLLPLDALIRKDPIYRNDDFVPAMLSAAHINGAQYSVPLSGSSADLAYRSDLFASAKLSPPKTWQEVLHACNVLRSQGVRYPLTLDVLEPFWIIDFIWQNGGDVLSPDQRKVTLSSPEALGGLQFVHDLIYKYEVIDPANLRGTRALELWGSGSAAMFMDGSWELWRYDESFPQLAHKWDVVPLPSGRLAQSFFGGKHLAIKRDSRAPELAWEFVRLATSVPWQMRLTEATGIIAANLKTLDLAEFHRKYPKLSVIRASAFTGRNTPQVSFFRKLWYDVFKNLVLDKIMPDPRADIPQTVATALPAMQAIVDDYWQQRA